MGAFSPPGARLHSLIGDALFDLPGHLVQRLEEKLTEHGMADPTPALIAHLTLMHHGEAADGALWDEPAIPLGRRGDLALVSRSLHGLSGILQILHAAQLARRHAGPEQHLGDHIEDALFHAGRELADAAAHALAGRR